MPLESGRAASDDPPTCSPEPEPSGVACPLHPSETVTTWSLLVAEAVMPGATRVQ